MVLEIRNYLAEGTIPYEVAWEWQRELVAKRQQGTISDTLLLLMHPPTVTYGKAAEHRNLLLTPEEYRASGIALVATDRGGDVTYHGPGQLVGYPILHLGEGKRDIHRYVRFLESVLIAASAEFGVDSAQRADFHAGVWVGDGYLAALGVRVSRWVTHHGFALNVTEEVQTGFSTIVPCGVTGKTIVSLSQLTGRTITVAEVADSVTRHFQQLYSSYFVEV